MCGQNVLEATIHDDFITKSGIRCIGFSCSTDFHLRSNEPIKELYSIFGKRSKLLEKSSKLYQSNLQNPQPFPSKLKILNFWKTFFWPFWNFVNLCNCFGLLHDLLNITVLKIRKVLKRAKKVFNKIRIVHDTCTCQ